MKRLFAAIFALPLLLGAGVALADSVEGTVEKVDPSSMSVWVNGQPYQVEQQAAGLKIDQIKIGDKVRMDYNPTSFVVREVVPAK